MKKNDLDNLRAVQLRILKENYQKAEGSEPEESEPEEESHQPEENMNGLEWTEAFLERRSYQVNVQLDEEGEELKEKIKHWNEQSKELEQKLAMVVAENTSLKQELRDIYEKLFKRFA